MNALQKRMEQLATNFVLGETICTALLEWFETGHVQLRNYPKKYHPRIWSQGAIGWRQIFNRMLSKLWLAHQENTITPTGQVRKDNIWGASIVDTCLRMMIDLWELRNKEIHGKQDEEKH